MTKRDARDAGYESGAGAIRYCEVSASDKREAGCQCKDVCEDCLTHAAYNSEQNSRQYSPFEFTAQEINDGRDPDGQWEAYDNGVSKGIKSGLKDRLKLEKTLEVENA